MLSIIVTIILGLLSSVLCDKEPPGEPQWPDWTERLVAAHLINMTGELLKDATMKLHQADTIRKNYQNTMSYELGTIAAGIQDIYKHMLEVYRTYSNLTDFMDEKYNVYEILNAFHVLQGDYNEIRLQQNYYYEVLARHEKEILDMKRAEDKWMKTSTTRGPGRQKLRRRLWQARDTDFNMGKINAID